MRKSADFEVSDRITTYYRVEGPDDANKKLAAGALAAYKDYIRAETLTNNLLEGEGPVGAFRQEERVGSTTLQLAVQR
jgi:hypothetical protein